MAEKWNQKPWDIDKATPEWIWMYRFDVVENIRGEIRKREYERSRQGWSR